MVCFIFAIFTFIFSASILQTSFSDLQLLFFSLASLTTFNSPLSLPSPFSPGPSTTLASSQLCSSFLLASSAIFLTSMSSTYRSWVSTQSFSIYFSSLAILYFLISCILSASSQIWTMHLLTIIMYFFVSVFECRRRECSGLQLSLKSQTSRSWSLLLISFSFSFYFSSWYSMLICLTKQEYSLLILLLYRGSTSWGSQSANSTSSTSSPRALTLESSLIIFQASCCEVRIGMGRMMPRDRHFSFCRCFDSFRLFFRSFDNYIFYYPHSIMVMGYFYFIYSTGQGIQAIGEYQCHGQALLTQPSTMILFSGRQQKGHWQPVNWQQVISLSFHFLQETPRSSRHLSRHFWPASVRFCQGLGSSRVGSGLGKYDCSAGVEFVGVTVGAVVGTGAITVGLGVDVPLLVVFITVATVVTTVVLPAPPVKVVPLARFVPVCPAVVFPSTTVAVEFFPSPVVELVVVFTVELVAKCNLDPLPCSLW